MDFLLDSHVALWLLTEPARLSPRAAAALSDDNHSVYLSVVSIWELEAKAARDKLSLPSYFWNDLDALGVLTLPITRPHALAVSRLPLLHRDPFDRMLVAQAMLEGLILITKDEVLPRYPVSTLW